MKMHNIHLDTSLTSYSQKELSISSYAPSRSRYDFNVYSSFPSHEWLIDSGASYHRTKDKSILLASNYCNTKNIYICDDRSFSVVGNGTIHLYNGYIKDLLCIPTMSYKLISLYSITHSHEGKIIEFLPHQVVIKDFKDPRNALATGIIDDITKLYNLENVGSSSLPLIFVAHNDDVTKLWHE